MRVLLLERPDDDTRSGSWKALDLNQAPEEELAFTGTTGRTAPGDPRRYIRDQLVLSASTGRSGVAWPSCDLDSPRIHHVPAGALQRHLAQLAAATPQPEPAHTGSVGGLQLLYRLAGHPYGVLRFNPDGTMEVMTGNAPIGGVIAFAPNTATRSATSLPRLLIVSAPAGAAVVF